jgi:hypothetical protein
MKLSINRNQILLAIGFLATQGPNLSAVAAWLASSGIPHMTGVVTLLGWMVTALGSLAIAWPRIRSALAAGGLATPPGAVAPWNPTRDAGPVPPVALVLNRETISGPDTLPPAGTRSGAGYPGKGGALLIFLVASLLSTTALAQAPSPQFGGCFAQGAVCLGPSASITLGELNLATSKFSGGIIPGVGYGVTYAQGEWYATGAAFYFSFKAGQDGPNQAIPSLVLSFANYVRVGTGCAITETSGPVQTQWLLLFGLGSDFGGTPKYQQAQLKAMRASAGGK